MDHLTPDWQSGIYKQEPQPELFNPGFLNSCTMRASILLQMEPSEIWDAEQEATTPGFRKEVVGDLFFSQIWVFLLCFQLPAHLAAVPCCPWSQEKQGTRHRAREKQGKNEITRGLIRAKVKKLNLLNSCSFIYCPRVIFGAATEQISAGLLGRFRAAAFFWLSVHGAMCPCACTCVPCSPFSPSHPFPLLCWINVSTHLHSPGQKRGKISSLISSRAKFMQGTTQALYYM